MKRIVICLLLAATAALAQPRPARQFLLRIEPVRKGFTLQTMTPEEAPLINQHAAYLKDLLAQGTLTFAGQAFAPTGLFGIIIVNAETPEAAAAILNADPSVKGKLFQGEVIPFRTVFERGASAPPASH